MNALCKHSSVEWIDLQEILPEWPAALHPIEIDIDLDDPILNYFSAASGVVDIEKIELESPALSHMKSTGVKLAVPLISQGDLIGLLNLGPRRSEQEYSSDGCD